MPRLVYIVTHPITARVLLRAQLARMRERGFELCWRSDIQKNISQLTDLWERV